MKVEITKKDSVLICNMSKEIQQEIKANTKIEMPDCKELIEGTIEEVREQYPTYEDLTVQI